MEEMHENVVQLEGMVAKANALCDQFTEERGTKSQRIGDMLNWVLCRKV